MSQVNEAEVAAIAKAIQLSAQRYHGDHIERMWCDSMALDLWLQGLRLHTELFVQQPFQYVTPRRPRPDHWDDPYKPQPPSRRGPPKITGSRT